MNGALRNKFGIYQSIVSIDVDMTVVSMIVIDFGGLLVRTKQNKTESLKLDTS